MGNTGGAVRRWGDDYAMTAVVENTKARELAGSGAVSVLFNDGVRCRARVRDAR
jgi:hypothetical protein